MKHLISTLLTILCNLMVFAQGNYQGSIKDQNNKVIPFATLHIEQASLLFKADSMGNYNLPILDSSYDVVVSAVGYESKKVTFKEARLKFDIQLLRKENVLEEVIVNTGYQQLPKERATGSFGIVTNKELNTITSKSILDRLEGKVAGLQFDNRSGSPLLNVRGMNSFSEGGSQPLLVVDNFPYMGKLEDLNPNDIASVTVLKDAAAASIWGARAGNGVIVITTKRAAASQKSVINFSLNTVIGQKPDLFYNQTLNSKDFIAVEKFLFDKGYYNATYNSSYNKLTVFSPVVDLLFKNGNNEISNDELIQKISELEGNDYRTDLMNQVYRPSINQQFFADLSTSSVVSKNRFSVGYDRGQSSMKPNKNDRVTLRSLNNWQLTKKMMMESNISLINAKSSGSASAVSFPLIPGGGKNNLYPYASLIDNQGTYLAVPRNYNQHFIDTVGQGVLLDWKYRPLEDLEKSSFELNTRHINVNFKVNYQIITPLKAELVYGYENQSMQNQTLMNEDAYYVRDLTNRYTQIVGGIPKYIVPLGGMVTNSRTDLQSHVLRGQINYNNKLQENHVLNLLIGSEISSLNTDQSSSGSYGFNTDVLTRKNVDFVNAYPIYSSLAAPSVIPSLDSYSGATSRSISFYFNGLYEYREKYGLSLSARKDGSNAFGMNTNSRWNPLWSSGVFWRISNEQFMKQISWVDNLKLRTTIGFSGIQAARSVSQTTIRFANNSIYTNLPYADVVSPPNPSLKWETVKMLNLAVDFSLFKELLMGQFEYYKKKSFDLISSDPSDATTGYSMLDRNVGAIRTNGFDMNLSSNMKINHVSWKTGINLSYVKNKVTEFKGTVGSTVIYMEGGQYMSPILGKSLYPVFSYKFAGLDPQSGDPRGVLNGEVSKEYAKMLIDSLQYLNYHGSALPPLYGAWNNTVEYGRFYLDLSILFKFGHFFKKKTIVYSNLFNSWDGHQDYEQRWQKTGDELVTTVPSMAYPADINRDNFYRNSEANILKGDLIRLQNIKLGYNFAFNSNRIKGQLYTGVQNLGLIWTKNKVDLDPDYLGMPSPRLFSVGASLTY